MRRTSLKLPFGSVNFGGPPRTVPRLAVYGLWSMAEEGPWEGDDLDVHLLPRGGPQSWLDYDGVVFATGCFHVSSPCTDARGKAPTPEQLTADLNQREGQAETLLRQGKPVIALVPPLPAGLTSTSADPVPDLLVRLLSRRGVQVIPLASADPVPTYVDESFKPHVARYGSAYAQFLYDQASNPNVTSLARCESGISAVAVDGLLYALPANYPQSQEACATMVADAARAVLRFRALTEARDPPWLDDVVLPHEIEVREQLRRFEAQLTDARTRLEVARTQRRNLLVGTGDQLVEDVVSLLRTGFGIDARCRPVQPRVEDAVLLAPDGEVIGVIEIKGKNGNFASGDIGQARQHRRRNNLPDIAPAIVLLNTLRSAPTLQAKDQPPDLDRIHHAVKDHVLLLRTLDLYRLVGLLQEGKVTGGLLKSTFENEAGWLKVTNAGAAVIKS
ncbi:MAG: hypothetical protein IT436_16120 [Phycisphaerales bacterium]|nr:hypothetical protein [Phycisphaerales bacterium]